MGTERRFDRAVDQRFVFEGIELNYQLIREKRKTMSASVYPSQAVLVIAPSEATEERIDEFIHRRLRWILQQKRYFAQFKRRPPKQYVSGETFRYRGRSYKLLICRDDSRERVSLQHGTLTVFTADPKDTDQVKKLIDRWYGHRMYKVFHERLDACFKRFDYEAKPTIIFKVMARRWGSYSRRTNRIILNQHLIEAATRYIDYVIIHELCHVAHRNHTREFYELLSGKLPNWERLKEELEIKLLG